MIDLNTATTAELEKLPGIGPVRAAAIVALRGRRILTRVEDLSGLDGFGPSLLDRLRPVARFSVAAGLDSSGRRLPGAPAPEAATWVDAVKTWRCQTCGTDEPDESITICSACCGMSLGWYHEATDGTGAWAETFVPRVEPSVVVAVKTWMCRSCGTIEPGESITICSACGGMSLGWYHVASDGTGAWAETFVPPATPPLVPPAPAPVPVPKEAPLPVAPPPSTAVPLAPERPDSSGRDATADRVEHPGGASPDTYALFGGVSFACVGLVVSFMLGAADISSPAAIAQRRSGLVPEYSAAEIQFICAVGSDGQAMRTVRLASTVQLAAELAYADDRAAFAERAAQACGPLD